MSTTEYGIAELESAAIRASLEEPPRQRRRPARSPPRRGNIEKYAEKVSVDKELKSMGYTPIEKILFKDDQGGARSNYIKVINPGGIVHYVELDEEGLVGFHDDSPFYMESQKSRFPESIKSGTFSCAESNACGIALECTGNVCVLTKDRGNPSQKVESNYILKDLASERHRIVEEHPLAYPIVRLSEIKANSSGVVDDVYKVTWRIRNTATDNCNYKMGQLEGEIQRLYRQYKEYLEIRNAVMENLNESITELDAINADYLANPELIVQEKGKYVSVVENLRVRHDLIVDVLRSCTSVVSLIDDVSQTTKKINEDFAFLKGKMERLKGNLRG